MDKTLHDYGEVWPALARGFGTGRAGMGLGVASRSHGRRPELVSLLIGARCTDCLLPTVLRAKETGEFPAHSFWLGLQVVSGEDKLRQ